MRFGGLGLASTGIIFLAMACGGAAATPTPTPSGTPTEAKPTPTTLVPTPTPPVAQTATATETPSPSPTGPSDTPTATAPNFSWTFQDVDLGVKPAMVLDSQDRPHITYMLEDKHGFVKEAGWDGSSWDITTLSEGYFYGPVDIAIGPDDVIHIAYHNHQDTQFQPDKGDAGYAVFRDGQWTVTDVFDEGHDGWDNRLVVDAQGRLHMSAIDPKQYGGSGVEYYFQDDDGEWHVEEVGSSPLSYQHATSVAGDPQGNPHITYHDQENKSLSLASKSASGWSIEAVDSEGDVGWFSYMVIDSEGTFHISYFTMTNFRSGVIKYATKDAGARTWTISEVDSLNDFFFGFVGARNVTSLALDSNGKPWIGYGDEETLKLAMWDGSQWVREIVTTASDRELGQIASLKLDGRDEPHIAYFEVTSELPLAGQVMYAHGVPRD